MLGLPIKPQRDDPGIQRVIPVGPINLGPRMVSPRPEWQWQDLLRMEATVFKSINGVA
jgi:hypothetical protein